MKSCDLAKQLVRQTGARVTRPRIQVLAALLQAQRDDFRRHFEAGGDTVVVGHTGMGATIRQWLTQFLAAEGHAGDGVAARNLLRKLEMTLRVQYSLSGGELSGSDVPGGEREAAHGA